MKDATLYRRFVIVAIFIAAAGVLMANLIQETRSTRYNYRSEVYNSQDCGGAKYCNTRPVSQLALLG